MVLDWLSGGAPSTPGDGGEGNLFMRIYNGDVQPADPFDPPETPAHLFPLRAFKQAIFGTPKPIEGISTPFEAPKHTTTHPGAYKAAVTAPRRKSADQPNTQGLRDQTLTSPTKRPGILLTPGTGNQRRKTVSFGDGSDTPRNKDGVSSGGLNTNTHTGFQQALLHSRISDDRAGRDPSSLPGPERLGDDITLDMGDPRSASGQYWKHEYEALRESTTLESRKLLKKEQIARRFAKQKDSEVQTMTEELQKESRKVAQLEAKLADYVARLSHATGGGSVIDRPSKDSPQGQIIRATTSDGRVDKPRDRSKAIAPDSIRTMNDLWSCNARDTKSMAEATRRGLDQTLKTHTLGQDGASQQLKPAVEEAGWADPNSTSDIGADSKVTGGNSLKAEAVRDGFGAIARNDRVHKASRPPLQPRVANPSMLREDRELKESKLSDERREAAKRRLQEKRLARAAATINGC